MSGDKLAYLARALQRLRDDAVQSCGADCEQIAREAASKGALQSGAMLTQVGRAHESNGTSTADKMARLVHTVMGNNSPEGLAVLQRELGALRDRLSNALADFFRSSIGSWADRNAQDAIGNRYLNAMEKHITATVDDFPFGIIGGVKLDADHVVSSPSNGTSTTNKVENEATTVTAQCNTCYTQTRHSVIHRNETQLPILDSGHSYTERWELIQCGGCDTISAHRLAWEIPDHGFEEFFPTRLRRRRPDWLAKLTNLQVPAGSIFPSIDLGPLTALLRETYQAYDNALLTLTAMGVRSVLDVAMNHLVGDVGTFPAKLDACEKKGLLSAAQKKHLGTVIDAGSAAAHRGFAPTDQDVTTLLEVMEHMIEAAFVHPHSVSGLSTRVPKRPTGRPSP